MIEDILIHHLKPCEDAPRPTSIGVFYLCACAHVLLPACRSQKASAVLFIPDMTMDRPKASLRVWCPSLDLVTGNPPGKQQSGRDMHGLHHLHPEILFVARNNLVLASFLLDIMIFWCSWPVGQETCMITILKVDDMRWCPDCLRPTLIYRSGSWNSYWSFWGTVGERLSKIPLDLLLDHGNIHLKTGATFSLRLIFPQAGFLWNVLNKFDVGEQKLARDQHETRCQFYKVRYRYEALVWQNTGLYFNICHCQDRSRFVIVHVIYILPQLKQIDILTIFFKTLKHKITGGNGIIPNVMSWCWASET